MKRFAVVSILSMSLVGCATPNNLLGMQPYSVQDFSPQDLKKIPNIYLCNSIGYWMDKKLDPVKFHNMTYEANRRDLFKDDEIDLAKSHKFQIGESMCAYIATEQLDNNGETTFSQTVDASRKTYDTLHKSYRDGTYQIAYFVDSTLVRLASSSSL